MRTTANTSAVGSGPGGTEPLLSPLLRRLAVYLHLQELIAGRDVAEIWKGPAHPRGRETLLARGARRVEVLTRGATRMDLPDGGVDLIFALDLDPRELATAVAEARRALRADGLVVLGVESRDVPGKTTGASYYDIVDACAAFPRVQMIGMAPFAGTTLIEYGVKDPEPILDGTLVERGERVEHYVVVAGPDRRGDFGYGVVQVPAAELARDVAPAARPLAAEPALQARIAKLEAELAESRRASTSPPPPQPRREAPVDRVTAELRNAIERHAAEMEAQRRALAERDAYIAELEEGGRRVQALEGRLAAAEAERSQAEQKEREGRRRIAELEGKLLAAGRGAPADVSVPASVPSAQSGDEVTALRKKLAEVESEVWKHMKARSEAEAAAAEVREDTVRKLKDARKLASVELMRAMEEATKKAVTLREELGRSEAERKAAVAELKLLREGAPSTAAVDDATHRRDLARAREEGEAAALAAKATAGRALADAETARVAAEAAARAAEERAVQLRGQVVSMERALQAAERERDEARAAVAAEQARARTIVEHARQAGAGSPEALDQALREAAARGRADAEQARSFEQLSQDLGRARAELAERERQLAALDRERPSRAEVERHRAALEASRAQLADVQLELSRRDAAVERASSLAAHERARSERLVAGERQAVAERNDARARAAEAQARLAALEGERDRLSAALEVAEAHAHKSDNDVKEKRERIRQLKRELSDAERRAELGIQRARTLEHVRARVHALEAAVADESTRIAGVEAALRNPE